MASAFLIIFGGMAIMGVLERLFPHFKLPYKKGWYLRAVAFNFIQLIVVMLGHYTWEHWIVGGHTMYQFGKWFSPFVGGFLAYFINTWIFYWWHRFRHESNWAWKVFHQFHHSPVRIEALTSFYKHPFEVMMNSILITILVYPILGLTIEGNGWFSVFSALGEFFYHMNVKTPFWIGYLIQRPESHWYHHLQNRQIHCWNYSDFPLWDILGGTFWNPTPGDMKKAKVGFSRNRESTKLGDMLKCKHVLKRRRSNPGVAKRVVFILLVVVGCLHTAAYIGDSPKLKGIAFSTGSSPLPLVFSAYNGFETFSTEFNILIELENTTIVNKMMDNKLYGSLQGPYNRRNVYGAIFSHGPFFDDASMIKIREQILHWGFCKPGKLAQEFGIHGKIKKAVTTVTSKTKGNEGARWLLDVRC